MKNTELNAQSKKDLVCPITDVMAAFGFDFDEQRGNNRHYLLENVETGKVYDFDINMLSNRWISRKDKIGGGMRELLNWMEGLNMPKADLKCVDFSPLMNMYFDLYKLTDLHPFTNIRVGKSAVVSIRGIQDREVLKDLAWREISINTVVNAGCKEAVVFNHKEGKTKNMLAFPCEDGNYYLFNGACYRPVSEGGISIVGKYHRDQFLFIYDNWLDCLAMMEQCHRNHIGMLCDEARHLIINGERNIDMAMDFLRNNPDFREVRCLLPKNEEGDRLFLKIAEVTGGGATDWSCLYEGLPTMAARVRRPFSPVLTDLLEAIKRDKEDSRLDISGKKEDKKQKTNVKKPELVIEPKGEPQKLVIKSEEIKIRPKKWWR